METILNRAYLITLASSAVEDTKQYSVIWGIVEKDETQRFQPEHYVCSSLILEHLQNNAFKTKNSIYRCLHKPTLLELPVSCIFQLREGVEPLLCNSQEVFTPLNK